MAQLGRQIGLGDAEHSPVVLVEVRVCDESASESTVFILDAPVM
jgi:hypothetical protein